MGVCGMNDNSSAELVRMADVILPLGTGYANLSRRFSETVK